MHVSLDAKYTKYITGHCKYSFSLHISYPLVAGMYHISASLMETVYVLKFRIGVWTSFLLTKSTRSCTVLPVYHNSVADLFISLILLLESVTVSFPIVSYYTHFTVLGVSVCWLVSLYCLLVLHTY